MLSQIWVANFVSVTIIFINIYYFYPFFFIVLIFLKCSAWQVFLPTSLCYAIFIDVNCICVGSPVFGRRPTGEGPVPGYSVSRHGPGSDTDSTETPGILLRQIPIERNAVSLRDTRPLLTLPSCLCFPFDS